MSNKLEIDKNKRVKQIRRDTDTQQNINFDLYTIDKTILNYIKDTIKPKIIENNNSVDVPVIFANPEKWKNIQMSGFYRDAKSGRLMVPLIAINRISTTKNNDIPVQDLEDNILKTVKTGWNPTNRYTSFAVNNSLKSTTFYSVLVPRYVKITYNLIAWTTYTKQMNNILEKFIFFENRYWGNKIYKFRSTYDNISSITEVTTGKDRMVKSNFDIIVNAYILPKEYKNKLTTKKFFSPAKIVINSETETKII